MIDFILSIIFLGIVVYIIDEKKGIKRSIMLFILIIVVMFIFKIMTGYVITSKSSDLEFFAISNFSIVMLLSILFIVKDIVFFILNSMFETIKK